MIDYYFIAHPRSVESFDDAERFPSESSPRAPRWLATDVAEYYYRCCDGHLDEWPVIFRLWNANGELIGDYRVELDYDPSFCATGVNP